MKLIIAEKPDLGRDIAKAIPGPSEEKNGVIQKGDYTITWVYGHLLKLRDPEAYDSSYAEWNLSQLPIFFPNWQADPIPDKTARVNQIKTLVTQADLIIHAGDPDDEGQLLIDELLRYYHYTGPVMRLDTGDTTTPALQRALASLRDNKSLESLGWSAYARSVSDFLVGINMSRYFTLKNHRKLTIGRVQTPTLGLVVNRDLQIESHKKIMYYELHPEVIINGKPVKAKFVPEADDAALVDGKFLNKALIQDLQADLSGKEYSCTIEVKEKNEEPPLPFNLVKLQSYCGKRWKYTPAEVLSITQSLREKHHAISYNRSDCQYLSTEHYYQAPDTIKAVLQNLGLPGDPFDPGRKSRCFNDENITAHFAIIPTDNPVDLSALSEQEQNVYQAIARHYLVQFLQPCSKSVTSLDVSLERGHIKASASRITDAGYTGFLKDVTEKAEDTTDKSVLHMFSAGSYTATIQPGEIAEKETKPPARYTQSSLNEDMTRIAKYVTDPDVKRLLLEKDADKKGENGSIGTSATRSMIISELIRKGYVSETKGKLISTPLGREFYRILPDELKLPDMTAHWYILQEEIKQGADPDVLISSVLSTIEAVMAAEHETIQLSGEVVGQCPLCKKPVLSRSKGFFCSNSECKFVIWKNIAGKTITDSIASQLLKCGHTATLKGFKSKSGKTFSAGLKLNRAKTGVEFIFHENANTKLFPTNNRKGGRPWQR